MSRYIDTRNTFATKSPDFPHSRWSQPLGFNDYYPRFENHVIHSDLFSDAKVIWQTRICGGNHTGLEFPIEQSIFILHSMVLECSEYLNHGIDWISTLKTHSSPQIPGVVLIFSAWVVSRSLTPISRRYVSLHFTTLNCNHVQNK